MHYALDNYPYDSEFQMPSEVVDPEALFRNIVHVLERGLRTSTYKLATMTALLDFSVKHHPAIPSRPLDVPLSDLAQRVMTLYWPQLRPFDGTQLRQSTQSKSLITESVETLRSEAGRPGEDLTFEAAVELAPDAFRREVDNVRLCLAQQPLPRLQRTATSPRSLVFLFDDSFLHDKVTRAELARHRNIIQLKPGVAYGLAVYSKQLHRLLEGMWVDDVLRINRLRMDERTRVEQHLFGHSLGQVPTQPLTVKSAVGQGTAASVESDGSESFVSRNFATRLNKLFETASPRSTPGEVVAKIRRSGFPMTVGLLSRLRAGIGSAPSTQTVQSLASYFGVQPSYFLDEEHPPNRQSSSESIVVIKPATIGGLATEDAAKSASKPLSMTPAAPTTGPTATADAADVRPAVDEDIWGRVFEDNLDDIAAGCEIRDDGCWNRPSNTPVRCRPLANLRKPVDLPKMNLHRWAWMVRNGFSHMAVPSHLVQIRRTCTSWTCCNPEHLYAASPGGAPLSNATIVSLLRQSASPAMNPVGQVGVGRHAAVAYQSRVVLQDDLASIRGYCSIGESGCWVARSSAPVACRARGDGRADGALPAMAPHRWAWIVAHGFSSSPLSIDELHVRRSCGQKKCCNPEHLYLTDLSGETLHASELKDPRRSSEAGDVRIQPSSRSLLAERLNELFEKSTSNEGVPYSSSQVAAELQEDGLPISEALIERYRTGSGETPNRNTIDALAYFFNVDPEYFDAGTHSAVVRDAITTDLRWRTDTDSTVKAVREEQNIPISVDDLGQVVKGLSEAISDCLAREPAQTQIAASLAPLLAEVGALLSEGDLLIDRPLLRRIIDEWNALAQRAKHKELITHLSRLASDDFIR